MLTTKQADKLIKSGETALFSSYGEQFRLKITSRDRWNVYAEYTWNGETKTGKFDRTDLTQIG